MARKADQPEIQAPVEEFNRYSSLNPEFAIPLSPRAQAVLRQVFCDPQGNVLSHHEIVKNIEVLRLRITAIIPQLEQSTPWQEALHKAKKRAESQPRHGGARIYRKPQPLEVASSEDDFRRAPRSFIKTVQRILTSQTERLAFGEDDLRDSPDGVDLSGLVIDPTVFNGKLLENLGLDEYVPKKRTGKIEKTAANKEAIPAIKEMLDHLEPFKLSYEQSRSGLRYFRLMRIGGGKNEGFLLGTQNINGKTILFKTDLHGAYRRIDHISDGYSQEIKILEEIVYGLNEVDRRVDTEWQQMKESGELDEIRRKLLAMATELRFVTNKHKTKMRNIIVACTSLQSTRTIPEKRGVDAAGRTVITRPMSTKTVLNPGAKRSKWNTVPGFVAERKADIRRIMKHLAEDRLVIESYIHQQEAPFARFYQTVESMHGQFKILNTAVPLTPADVEKITRNLAGIKADCAPRMPKAGNTSQAEGVRKNGKSAAFFEPYLSFAGKMVEHIDATIAILKAENIDRTAAASEFTKIYLVTKIQYFFHELQKFYDKFLSPHKTPFFREMLDEINGLDRLISAKRLNEKVDGKLIKTPEYNKVFAAIHRLINTLRAQAETATSYMAERSRAETETGKSEKEKEALKIKAKMHDLVKNFRFEDLLAVDPPLSGAADKSQAGGEVSTEA